MGQMHENLIFNQESILPTRDTQIDELIDETTAKIRAIENSNPGISAVMTTKGLVGVSIKFWADTKSQHEPGAALLRCGKRINPKTDGHLTVRFFDIDDPETLYVIGEFTKSGRLLSAQRIAIFDGGDEDFGEELSEELRFSANSVV